MICGDKFRLQAANFMHAEPQDIKPYFEYFACQLNFNQAENQLLIPLSLADETLVGANPELALLNDQVATRRLAGIESIAATAAKGGTRHGWIRFGSGRTNGLDVEYSTIPARAEFGDRSD